MTQFIYNVSYWLLVYVFWQINRTVIKQPTFMLFICFYFSFTDTSEIRQNMKFYVDDSTASSSEIAVSISKFRKYGNRKIVTSDSFKYFPTCLLCLVSFSDHLISEPFYCTFFIFTLLLLTSQTRSPP